MALLPESFRISVHLLQSIILDIIYWLCYIVNISKKQTMAQKSTNNTNSGDGQQVVLTEIAPVANDTSEDVSIKDRILMALGDVNSVATRITNSDQLEEATFGIMDSLPESMLLVEQIKTARSVGDNTLLDELIAKQRAIYQDISEELALIAGIETDQARVKRENKVYRQKIVERFAGVNVDMEEVDSGHILSVLGMLKKNENGDLVFNFPRDIFPPHICEKWDHYIDIVARHVSSEKHREEGADNVRDITLLNGIRTQAHNNISRAIKEFLKMDSWDLEKCRRLVIKMRDAKLPNVETAERETTAAEIARLISLVRGVTKHT